MPCVWGGEGEGGHRLWARCLWGQIERLKGWQVRPLPAAPPPGLTLLGFKEVCKVSFTREIYARGSVGFLWLLWGRDFKDQ